MRRLRRSLTDTRAHTCQTAAAGFSQTRPATAGTSRTAGGTSGTDLEKQTWLAKYATPTNLQSSTPAVGSELEKQAWLAKYTTPANLQSSTPAAITADQISTILRDQFGMVPKRRAIGYSKPYPNEYDLIPLPPKYRLPEFSKFSGSDGSSSIEHKMKKFKFGELFKKGTTSTGRPSRAATRIRQSYNEDILAPSFAPEEDNGPPNASTFPCYDFLRNAGILEDFLTLVNRAGLTTYMGDEREQYYMLTKIFVESFQFDNKQYEPTVAFRIYGNPVTMQLKDFCLALDIDPAGTASRIDDNPRDLLELYRGITNDDCRTIQRGKIRNIQLPAIKYFAYYIATSILGRENTSNISSYHLAFLNIALTGQTSYHLGALIARRLSTRGPIFGGTIALRVLTYLDLPIDPNDVPLAPRRLDIAAMKSHHFVTTESTLDNMAYRMLFADGDEKEIPLPQPGLFDIDRQPWSRTKEEVEEHMKIQEFHQQHDSEDVGTSYDHTVTYPGASSSTYPEYDPSSYYGDTTSWDRWD
ncbi:hypothetical protein QYE76_026212 [Lolium multiflorum]|uniref:Arabidopsis retrotransposon Orf1 C-terminal domain-containing protein n=1 Tax=Lolium multiflorum TaxID=4521 RepID=A0AAD8RH27_LOLMU|nr:hypothetical protein QYE76_026212 [Lolium multiflorum]